MNVVVTGGGRGIGRAIARSLGKPGNTLVLNYLRNVDAAEATRRGIVEAGGEVRLIKGDVRSTDCLARLSEQLECIDVVVHCAAVGVFRPIAELQPMHWDVTLESSLRSFYLLAKLCAPRMVQGGSLIGISSLGAVKYSPGYGAIAAAKAGLEALVRQLAVELAPKGVRVNCVRAGLVATDSLRNVAQFEVMRQYAEANTPLGRLCTPDDIARAVAFLVSGDAAFVTGHALVVDGGLSVR
jgi:enoyl-[acyl-carrier protein] reductase III